MTTKKVLPFIRNSEILYVLQSFDLTRHFSIFLPSSALGQYTAHHSSRKSQLARFTAHPFFRPGASEDMAQRVYLWYPGKQQSDLRPKEQVCITANKPVASLAHFDLISRSHEYFSRISTLLEDNSTVLAVRSAYNPP